MFNLELLEMVKDLNEAMQELADAHEELLNNMK